jgi:hypothetical protein
VQLLSTAVVFHCVRASRQALDHDNHGRQRVDLLPSKEGTVVRAAGQERMNRVRAAPTFLRHALPALHNLIDAPSRKSFLHPATSPPHQHCSFYPSVLAEELQQETYSPPLQRKAPNQRLHNSNCRLLPTRFSWPRHPSRFRLWQSPCLSSLRCARVCLLGRSAPFGGPFAPSQSVSSSVPAPTPGMRLELHKKSILAASQRTCESVRGFTSLLSEGVLRSTAGQIADALLELLDVLLVRSREIVDLVYMLLMRCCTSFSSDY